MTEGRRFSDGENVLHVTQRESTFGSKFNSNALPLYHDTPSLSCDVRYKHSRLMNGKHTHAQISRWITELFLSHLLGYILYLVIEAPFNNLTKQFFGKVSKQEAGKRIDGSPSRDVNANIRKTASKIKST